MAKTPSKLDIAKIAGIILEDEALIPEGFSGQPNHPGVGTYHAKDVELDEYTYADVTYEYDVAIHGQYYTGDWNNQPEYPDIDLTNVQVVDMQAHDIDGHEIQPDQSHAQAAIVYFERYLKDEAAAKELEEESQ